MISKFSGKYRFLSNFWPVEIAYEDITYPSVEHAYQASKSLDKKLRQGISKLQTPGSAKRKGRELTLRKDWEDIKTQIMYDLLLLKFAYPDLRENLIATNDLKLVEGNHWGDTFWGVCNGKGNNYLGKLLMQIRREIA